MATARAELEALLRTRKLDVTLTSSAVWTLADDRSVYVVQADDAGNGVVTLFVDDLDARLAEIAARGLEPDERETYSNGVRKAIYRDPDGNEVGLGGPPRAAPAAES